LIGRENNRGDFWNYSSLETLIIGDTSIEENYGLVEIGLARHNTRVPGEWCRVGIAHKLL
jgi:hypothetical protein